MTRKLTLIQDEDTGFWYIAECTGFSYISISNQATTKLIVSPEDKKYAWNLYAIPEVHKKWLGESTQGAPMSTKSLQDPASTAGSALDKHCAHINKIKQLIEETRQHDYKE